MMCLLVLMLEGIQPTDMANIVSERLSRLDHLVIDVEARVFLAPLNATFEDRSSWDGPYPPGPGQYRRLRVVRPYSLEESWTSEESRGSNPARITTAYTPGRAVQRIATQTGPTVYNVKEDLMTSSAYNSVPLLTMFDIHVHESFVPGLNTLRLLRDYPTEFIGVEGDVYTYRTQLHVECVTDWTETHEYDLNSRGTLLRHRMRRERPTFWFEREFRVLATQDVNGAELPTEFVCMTTNSVVENYGIHSFTVTSAQVDESLVASRILFEPERRNCAIHSIRADLSRVEEHYDADGVLVASTAVETVRDGWRKGLLPSAATGALVTVFGLARVRRARLRGTC